MNNIKNNFFANLPFPHRIQCTSPYLLELDAPGMLFDAPNYTHKNDNFWETIDSEGWKTCNAGFAVFVKKIPGKEERLLVIHGLKIKPFWTHRGKSEGSSVVLDSGRFKNYVETVINQYIKIEKDIFTEIDRKTNSLVEENFHEIRSMTTNLYHAGIELQEKLAYADRHTLDLSKNLVALSELVSSRIVLAELSSSGLTTLQNKKRIQLQFSKNLKKSYAATQLMRQKEK